MTDLENQFNADMMQIYVTAKKELGYNSTRFLQMLMKYDGLATAHKLIASEGGIDGFTKFWEYDRLDLTVEAHVLKPEYETLFSEDERKMCRDRLEKYRRRQFGFFLYKGNAKTQSINQEEYLMSK